jgi:hypothetical protein
LAAHATAAFASVCWLAGTLIDAWHRNSFRSDRWSNGTSNICTIHEAWRASIRYDEKRNAYARVSRVGGLEEDNQQARWEHLWKVVPDSSGHRPVIDAADPDEQLEEKREIFARSARRQRTHQQRGRL